MVSALPKSAEKNSVVSRSLFTPLPRRTRSKVTFTAELKPCQREGKGVYQGIRRERSDSLAYATSLPESPLSSASYLAQLNPLGVSRGRHHWDVEQQDGRATLSSQMDGI